MKKRIGKNAETMPFSWIFAIIVGGIILFLAIFAVGKFIRTGEQKVTTETAASLISLFDPLETGLASGKAQEIKFQKDSKIFFECDTIGFGKQTLSFSEKTFGDFSDKSQEISIKDKYIFTEEIVEGKTIYVFSKPFFMPFKVSDITVLISAENNYCIYDAPKYFKESLEGLNLGNIIFVNESFNCNGINVCFNDENCDIKVVENQKYVLNKKYGKRVYYIDNLIYGAIFSSQEIYECNVKRIKSRFDELVEIYLGKNKIISSKGCDNSIGLALASMIGLINDSRNLFSLYNRIQEIDTINKATETECRLFETNFEDER